MLESAGVSRDLEAGRCAMRMTNCLGSVPDIRARICGPTCLLGSGDKLKGMYRRNRKEEKEDKKLAN